MSETREGGKEKAMTFEEWWDSPETDAEVREGFSRDDAIVLWNAARQGMIPAHKAVVIPEVWEWPEDATHVELVYINERRAGYDRYIQTIDMFPRPRPAAPEWKQLLKKHEWENGECVECGHSKQFGHSPDCRLAKLLEGV